MSIADRARDANFFVEAWRTSFEPGSPHVEDAEHQLFRLNRWASNNSIFEISRDYIDWRLRNVSAFHSSMEDLLDDLKINLIGNTPSSVRLEAPLTDNSTYISRFQLSIPLVREHYHACMNPARHTPVSTLTTWYHPYHEYLSSCLQAVPLKPVLTGNP